jgi:hypothetical protein
MDKALLMTLSLLLWPAMSRAVEIYKSVDAAGHVTYSDRPDNSNPPVSSMRADDDRDVGDAGDVAEMTAATAPPALPALDQPPCPEEGDLWTPGYWSWDGAAYYWAPGAWVSPPSVGAYWTPGYWVYVHTVFVFHRGYWGPQVGYYGGINYGFGYWGTGYTGGRWIGTAFAYNRAVNNVNAHLFHHVYDEPSHGGISRVSYNGGPGGTVSVPTAEERIAAQSRLPSQPQRMSRTPAVAPPPTVENAPSPPRAPVNATTRTPTPLKTSRPRSAPAIKAIHIN